MLPRAGEARYRNCSGTGHEPAHVLRDREIERPTQVDAFQRGGRNAPHVFGDDRLLAKPFNGFACVLHVHRVCASQERFPDTFRLC